MIALIQGRITPSICDKLFRRDLFNGLSEDDSVFRGIKINEDLLLNFMLLDQIETCCSIPEPLYVWRERENSATTQALNDHKIYDPIKVKKYIMDHADESILPYAKGRYLSSLINTYGTIAHADLRARSDDLTTVRRMLMDADGFGQLSANKKVQYVMIRFAPHIYAHVIRKYKQRHIDTDFVEKT